MLSKLFSRFKNRNEIDVEICAPSYEVRRRPDETLDEFLDRARAEADAFFAQNR